MNYIRLKGECDDDELVRIMTNDNVAYKLCKEDAEKSQTLQDLIEDSGIEQYIPINSTNQNFKKIIPIFEGKDVLKVKDNITPEDWLDIAEIVNYLDINPKKTLKKLLRYYIQGGPKFMLKIRK